MLEVLDDMQRKINMLESKLSVRNRQYIIAVEGFNEIVNTNAPIGIAGKTLQAMEECAPKELE